MLAPLLAFGMLQQVLASKPKPMIVVEIDCSCDGDAISSRYASKLRDILAASPRFVDTSSNDPKDSSGRPYEHFRLSIVTVVSEGTKDSPHSIVIGTAILLGHTFIGQSVQSCNAGGIEECAEDTWASFDVSVHGKESQ